MYRTGLIHFKTGAVNFYIPINPRFPGRKPDINEYIPFFQRVLTDYGYSKDNFDICLLINGDTNIDQHYKHTKKQLDNTSSQFSNSIKDCPLSNREMQVIAEKAQGKTEQEAALSMNIAKNTVRALRSRALDKLDCRNIREAYVILKSRGYLS